MFICCVVKLALMRAQLIKGILIVCKDDLVGFSWEFLRENYRLRVFFFLSYKRQAFIIINVITVHK